MRHTLLRAFCLIVMLGGSAAHAEPGPLCATRECLTKLVDDYFAALVAHDAKRIAFADDVKFVENVVRKQPGEGLWQTASAVPGAFRIYVPDPVSGQVGFMGVLEESGKPVMIALRLKVFDGRVTEAEHVLARNLRAENLPNLATPRPALTATVPAKQRLARHVLVGIGHSYYAAVDFNDGSLAPFAKECERRENGMEAANRKKPPDEKTEKPNYSALLCGPQLDTNMMSYIDSIDNVRVLAADPVTGLAFGLSHFRHGMKEKATPIRNMPGVTSRPVNYQPFDLPAAHVFKIVNGRIYEIEAMGFLAPYDAPSGW
jgi:hypothetical protein